MKVSSFYQPCKENAIYDSLKGSNPNFEFAIALSKIWDFMKGGCADETALLAILKKELENSFKDEWFRLSFQKEQTILDNLKKFSRFFYWLSLDKYHIIDTNVSLSAPIMSDELSMSVSLIIQRENLQYEAIVVHTGKNPFSFKGKSVHTMAQNNLYGLVPKYVLEGIYPGLIVSNVYLTQDKDTLGDIKDKFLVSQGKGSNVHRLYFEEFMDDGSLCYDALYHSIVTIMNTPVAKNCYMCRNMALCNCQTLDNLPAEYVSEENSYVMPSFTETQREVVEHEDGPLLVVAQPGSGKTAAIVGRIARLIEKGIDPDYILAITFTKEAAKELKTRCLSFCEEDNLPTVSTINALCYQILRENSEELGYEVELLTQKERLSIIENLVEALPMVKGLNHSMIDGPHGLLQTINRKLDKYIKLECNNEAFLKEEKELDETFIELASFFIAILKERHFITFEEQISLCVDFLKNNPKALRDYQNLYQYIMVDEYQDIDATQNEFINLLAGHGNLVVVGDDDQAIYGFRGGSHEYMLNFEAMYENAKVVVFSENFRTTKRLAAVSNELISKNHNRVPKQVNAVRGEGWEPRFLDSTDISAVETCVAEALKQGYQLKDIAILSRTNKTLEGIKESLSYPCVLEKAYLINEPLFVACFYSVALIRSDYKDNVSMLHLCKLFGVALERTTKSLYEEVSHNKDDASVQLLNFLAVIADCLEYSPSDYINAVASLINLEGTKCHGILCDMIRETGIETLDELFIQMDEMVRYEDDTKVSVSNVDAILLITNHESKGREFKVVILIDDTKTEPETEEQRRVLYVALTRAQDMLYVLKEAEKTRQLERRG